MSTTPRIPCRLIRPQTEICKLRPALTERDQKRRDYILEAARNVFIQHGTAGITLTEFAYALGMAPVTIRRHVSDMHHLFALILNRYLHDIITAVGVVQEGPDLFARRRAAYFRITRGICNVPTPMHFLLLRERFSLPEDELAGIESQRRAIGYMLDPHAGEDVLCYLDYPTFDLKKIEALVATAAAIDQDRADNPPPIPVFDPPPPAPKPAKPPRALRPMPRVDPALADIHDSELIGALDPDPSPPDKHTPIPWPAFAAGRLPSPDLHDQPGGSHRIHQRI
jgi:AcrR family transcriptional regulator